jgi:hypothetical protein
MRVGANEAGDGSLASRYRRRQLKTWFAFTSYRRAVIETDAPGSDVAATISRFNASCQRLCRLFASVVSMSAFVDTFPPALTHQSTWQTRSCAESPQGGAHRAHWRETFLSVFIGNPADADLSKISCAAREPCLSVKLAVEDFRIIGSDYVNR